MSTTAPPLSSVWFGLAASDVLDLCSLHFDMLPGVSPAALFRTPRLTPMKLLAVGFAAGVSGARSNEIPEFETILDEKNQGWLQTAQLRGGAPDGFSGAPVFIRVSGTWRVVGMLRLGGYAAATSRLIGID